MIIPVVVNEMILGDREFQKKIYLSDVLCGRALVLLAEAIA